MCGRFALTAKTDEVEKLLPELYSTVNINPRYNIAPSTEITAILNIKPDEITSVRWGLVPFWAKDISIGNKMINARSETIFEKPSFKKIIYGKRCLIPVTGFFEWKKLNKNEKMPYYIKMKTSELFTFAGLWDKWIDKENGEEIISATIITTQANNIISKIHNRMPVIIKDNDRIKWLKKDLKQNELEQFFTPYENKLLEIYPIKKLINSPSNDSAEIIEPI